MRKLLFSLFVLCASPLLAQTPTESEADSYYPLDLQRVGLTLPKTTSPELQRIYNSKSTIFYKLPQVWQHYIPPSTVEVNNITLGTKSLHTTKPVHAVYFSSWQPAWHANHNFPWETTAGLNSIHKQTDNPYRTINFINLPEEDGKPVPILILNEYPIKWIYPPGTTVGEVLYVIHEGKRYVQEIRTRTKGEDSYYWEPNLYRPIESREEFEKVTGIRDYIPAKKYFHFRNPQETEVFMMEGLVERLPEIPEEQVKKILSMPFKALETDKEVWSPASDQEFSILPKDYCISLLKSVDAATCANCHRQTQISVRNLTPKDPDVLKYPNKAGNIRGSDAVFTWHPFSNKSVRTNDKDNKEPTVRDYDLDNGFIMLADEDNNFGGSRYKLTRFVQESLKPYELPNNRFLHPIREENITD